MARRGVTARLGVKALSQSPSGCDWVSPELPTLTLDRCHHGRLSWVLACAVSWPPFSCYCSRASLCDIGVLLVHAFESLYRTYLLYFQRRQSVLSCHPVVTFPFQPPARPRCRVMRVTESEASQHFGSEKIPIRIRIRMQPRQVFENDSIRYR